LSTAAETVDCQRHPRPGTICISAAVDAADLAVPCIGCAFLRAGSR
jgi:hypothetical protein